MTDTRTPRRITPDRVAISAVLGGAVIIALVFLTLGTFDAVRTLVAPEIRVSLVADETIGSLNGVPVDGNWDTARVAFAGADPVARALIAGGAFLTAMTTVALALGVAWLCRTILRGNAPFTRSLTRLARFTALTLVIAPTAGRFMTDLGTNILVERAGLHDPISLGFGFDFAPWAAGIVIATTAELFVRAERMQRDTEGLV